ncbi:hypothetical protein [Palleronia caenipelagi]|uniref:hypothetical protein n=1 Tax=Palleronia caenipelagi TaxID=2489174 RepID=UPI00163D5E90|nr:hypothetical protein [Palleronia caenipelagi]
MDKAQKPQDSATIYTLPFLYVERTWIDCAMDMPCATRRPSAAITDLRSYRAQREEG